MALSDAGSVYDAVIVGAGSAGSVLAYRLALAGWSVALVEAGPDRLSPTVAIPRAWPVAGIEPGRLWRHAVADRPEVWVRGRGVGGSSAVNGMVWCRGFAEDYDGWAAMGAAGWSWSRIAAAFRSLEECVDDPDPTRGHGGPVPISKRSPPAPWGAAFYEAARQAGWPVLDGLNGAAREGIGVYDHSISAGGRRSDARHVFLTPRPSGLRILANATVDRVLLDAGRARAVEVRGRNGQPQTIQGRQIILSAGTLDTPRILHRSGIGDATRLAAEGIAPRHHLAGVGQGMAEHLVIALPHRACVPGHNSALAGWRLGVTLARHLTGRRTVLGHGASEMGGFLKTRPDLDLPDMQLAASPYSYGPPRFGLPRVEHDPGLTIIGYMLQPESRGAVEVTGEIRANWLATERDRQTAVAMMRRLREFAAQPALAALIEQELFPGADLRDDADLLAAFESRVASGLHAIGTCRMGARDDPRAVVTGDLNLRGLRGLRVVDASVIPVPIRGNTNGPVMALAWAIADEMIAEGKT